MFSNVLNDLPRSVQKRADEVAIDPKLYGKVGSRGEEVTGRSEVSARRGS
jgi:hypothetical protein